MGNNDLKLIKKHYGEKMMHLCRELFPTILERDGLLYKLISENFDYSRFLCDDIINSCMEEEFKDFIFSQINVEKNYEELVKKSPFELLSEAGYNLYECHNEEDIQSFKKYYKPGEELCTFRGGRLRRCYVFFAVKKNVDEIKREDFAYPDRQDLYGTSVISIQFTKDASNTISIKNRYNHTVNNPDSTFSNNLDNIISGLTASFNNEYHLNINSRFTSYFELSDYVLASDGKFYKYNYEINNVYYCPNNIIIDNFVAKKLEKEKYIVFDYFILDLVNKKLISKINDSFVNSIGDIDEVNVLVDRDTFIKKIIINKDIVIKIDKYNRIVEYDNPIIERVDDNFLAKNKFIKSISMSNVKEIDNEFLPLAKEIKKLDLPNVKKIKDYFLRTCDSLESIVLPKLEEAGNNFISKGKSLVSINLASVKKFGNYCFFSCNNLKKIEISNVEEIGDNFASDCKSLESVCMPNLKNGGNYLFNNCVSLCFIEIPSVEKVGNNFCSNNVSCKSICMPNVVEIGDRFFYVNEIMDDVRIPKVEKIGDYFLGLNQSVKSIDFFNLREVGDYFFYKNLSMESIRLLNVKRMGDNFLPENKVLDVFECPKVEKIGNNCLFNNKYLKKLSLDNVKEIGNYFLFSNCILDEFIAPKVQIIGDYCLSCNNGLKGVSLLNLEYFGKDFLRFCKSLKTIDIPNVKKIGDNFCDANKFIASMFKYSEIGLDNELGGRRL